MPASRCVRKLWILKRESLLFMRFVTLLKGNSTSKTPSLQNVSLKLAEILQAYSILKVMILCKISAPKSESSAL